MKFKILHNRSGCIGCQACASVCSKFWEMNDEDGFADLIDGDRLEGGDMELEISEADFKCNMDAAESCPVNVIHISNLESGEELI